MENLGDWIYILVLGVIGLSSLLTSGKKKKVEEEAKKQAPPPPEVVTPQTASDRDFWDDFTDWVEKTTVVEAKPKVQKTVSKPKPTPKPQATPFLTGESEIERKIRQQTPMGGLSEEETAAAPLVTAADFNEPESLRKAVIYAEILNRKY
ncbi:hypothetical protein [Parabacteroides sp. PF5-6]|uniref:hypothetical protein n=1 Tax=Parabacteroides sp. PF5-6 TaxID=1742403 RepID=UPI002405E5E4|nr:hypothetical protein [Parabacteroides sp. PF5-6]MDF9829213.1 hypothetical protein [Parabacteroides sp. PF5-6]